MKTLDCDRSNDLIMKYMDGCLSAKEAIVLKQHIDVCSSCAEDFKIYSEMLSGFGELTIVNAPDDFEVCVMNKIQNLEENERKVTIVKGDNIVIVAFGVISAIFGLAFIAYLNNVALMEFLSANGYDGYVNAIMPLTGLVNELIENIVYVSSSAVNWFLISLDKYKFILLAVCVILAAVLQYALSISKKQNYKSKHR